MYNHVYLPIIFSSPVRAESSIHSFRPDSLLHHHTTKPTSMPEIPAREALCSLSGDGHEDLLPVIQSAKNKPFDILETLLIYKIKLSVLEDAELE